MCERDEVVGEPILQERIARDQAAAVPFYMERMPARLDVFGDQYRNRDVGATDALVGCFVDVEAIEARCCCSAGNVCHALLRIFSLNACRIEFCIQRPDFFFRSAELLTRCSSVSSRTVMSQTIFCRVGTLSTDSVNRGS